MQVSAIKPGSLFEEIGIKNGDVITELNGIAIDSPEESAKILRELSEAQELTVTIRGDDGTPRPWNVDIGAIEVESMTQRMTDSTRGRDAEREPLADSSRILLLAAVALRRRCAAAARRRRRGGASSSSSSTSRTPSSPS